MKTSLEIDDRLYQAARLHAARERTTVRALVEEGLARVLGMPVVPPVDDADRSRRLAALEALCAQVSALPLLHDETPEQILGYDGEGTFG